MDPSNPSNSKATSLLQKDDQYLSSLRKRNKTLILIFFSLIIVLALIIGAIIISLVHKHNLLQSKSSLNPNPAMLEFCRPSGTQFSCINSISSAIKTTPQTDPNKIFELCVEKTIKQISNIVPIMASNEVRLINCSTSLDHAVRKLDKTLGIIRANPDIETQTYEERRDTIAWVVLAVEDLTACGGDLQVESTAVDAVVTEIRPLLRYSKDFLMDCDAVNENYRYFSAMNENESSRSGIVEDLMAVSLFGSQYIVLVILFCLLLRIYCCL